MNSIPAFLTVAFLVLPASFAPAADMVVGDFEGPDFGAWEVNGEAFGKGPAAGPVNGQMGIPGTEGAGFANSFHGGDDATGTLTSPEFTVGKRYLNFLIGGGKFAGKTCMKLLSGGRVVRTATGPNIRPGGSERLDPSTWDLADLAGKTVRLQIVDDMKGGWGHVTVDHIVQSDTPAVVDATRKVTIGKRYLTWPVSLDPKLKRRFFFTLDGGDKPFAFYDICLSNNPDFWVFTDLANFQGHELTVSGQIPGGLDAAWQKVSLSDTYPGETDIYREPQRPGYHFTSRRGWINDPNGLVYHQGAWHLFYQHNPYNHNWDNMTWGHAVSADLLHWKELPPALFPDAEGYMYSGSAVVAPKGTTGLPVKGGSALVLAYTANGNQSYLPGIETVQSIASSDDNGVTFRKYPSNPVIPHFRAENRDPKVFWHEPTQRWVLNLYYDGNDYAIYRSPDLIRWEKTCDYRIPGEGECPDMFELPVDGDPGKTKWVVWGANGKYMVGTFDGRDFTAESGVQRHYFGSAYAGQTYGNAPGGRRVHIGWMRSLASEFHGAPFNCQMTLPMDFSLKAIDGKLRLWAEPSPEVAKLRQATKEWKDLTFAPGDEDPLADLGGARFEIEAVMDASSPAGEMGFNIFGESSAVWKKEDQSFTGAEGKQAPANGEIHIRLFVDTVSMEVFVNGTYVSRYLKQTPGIKPVRIAAGGGAVRFKTLKIHNLQPVWNRPQ